MNLQTKIEQMFRDDGSLVSSEWHFIDKCLRRSGIKKGSLITLIGSRKIGKTYFVVNWIYRLIRERRRVYYFSAEMYAGDVGIRFIQLFSKQRELDISLDFENGGGKKYKKINEYVDYYCTVDDLTPVSLNHISSVINEKAAVYDFFFIDPHMQVDTGSDDIYSKVTRMYEQFLSLARNTGARIVVVVHSNTRGSTRFAEGSVLPTISQGMGSSAIERLSDMIITMARPDLDDKCDSSRENGLIVKVHDGKFNDSSGIIWLPYDRDTSEIKEEIF